MDKDLAADFARNAVASFSIYFAAAPLERLKHMATTDGEHYDGLIGTTRFIIQNQGMKSLWRGAVLGSFTNASSDCVSSIVHRYAHTFLLPRCPSHSLVPTIASSALGGLAASAVVHPLEMAQLHKSFAIKPIARSYPLCALHLVHTRVTYYSLCDLMSPEKVDAFVANHPALKSVCLSLYGHGIVSPTLITYPLVVTSALSGLPLHNIHKHANASFASTTTPPFRGLGFKDATIHIYKQHGLGGFFRGAKPLALLSIATNVVMSYVEKHNKDQDMLKKNE